MEPKTENNGTDPVETDEQRDARLAAEAEKKAAEEKAAADKAAAEKAAARKLTPDEVKKLKSRLAFMVEKRDHYASQRAILSKAGKTSHHKENVYVEEVKELEALLKDY